MNNKNAIYYKRNIDLLSGGLSGATQLIIGHPLDTLKTYKQNSKNKFSITLNDVRKLYYGISFPLVSNLINNAILFSNYNYFKEKIRNTKSKNTKQNNNLINIQSGMAAGFVSSPIMYMFDYSKIRRQMERKPKFFTMNLKKLNALPISSFRHILAYGIYFPMYDYLKNERKIHPILSGGLAGLSNWGITYFLDTLKTRQIHYSISLHEAWKKGGDTNIKRFLGLYKGYRLMLFRAFPTNALGFYSYQVIHDFLENKN